MLAVNLSAFTVTDAIPAQGSFSTSAIHRIPDNETAFLLSWYAGIIKAGGQTVTAEVRLLGILPPSTTLNTGHIVGFTTTGTTHHQHSFVHAPVPIAGGAILKLEVATVSANDLDISGGFDMLMVAN